MILFTNAFVPSSDISNVSYIALDRLANAFTVIFRYLKASFIPSLLAIISDVTREIILFEIAF